MPNNTRYFIFVNRMAGGSGVSGFVGEYDTEKDAYDAMEKKVHLLLGYHPDESIGYDIVRYTADVEFRVIAAGYRGPIKDA